MINEAHRLKIKETYGLDIVNDVLLADEFHATFFLDYSHRETAEILVLSGDLSLFGLNQQQNMPLTYLMGLLEINNPVSEVIGKENYYEYLYSIFDVNKDVKEIYFPIRTGKGTLWVVCGFQAIGDPEKKLIFGRVNWISWDTPDAIKYYQNTYKDVMTNLFSREALRYHLEHARPTDHSYGLYFDIDNFKRINDIFGHRIGDRYLLDLAGKFIGHWEEDVIYYRIGGDEFFIYLINSTEEEAYRKAMQIIYDVEKLNPEGQQAEVSASVGIIPIIGSEFDIEELLDLADRTMYHAKSKGKGNISYARDV